MKSSNVLVAFATMGSLIGSSAAIADEKIATATVPADMSHQQNCLERKKTLLDESKALAKIEPPEGVKDCGYFLKRADQNDRTASLIRECAADFGMTNVDAGKFILQYTYYAQGMRKGCSPNP